MTSIKFEELDVSKLSFEEVKLQNKNTLLLPRLDGKEVPGIRLPRIELTHYGVPKLGQYFKTDKDRMFIQLPVEGELLERFAFVDYTLQTNEMKQKLFKNTNCDYSPIVKYGSKGPYIKVKIDTDYQTGNIETLIYHSEKSIDGKYELNPCPLEK